MINSIKSERRWQVRKLIIAINLIILGFAYWLDFHGIKAEQFMSATEGFQLASAAWFSADYMTKEGGGFK